MAQRLNQVGDPKKQPRQKEQDRPQRPGGCVCGHEHVGTGVPSVAEVHATRTCLAVRDSPGACGVPPEETTTTANTGRGIAPSLEAETLATAIVSPAPSPYVAR